jgi:pimeloyl-ACP methyl ester carboxylesterase
VSDSPTGVISTECPLPWGPIARGFQWGSGADLVLLLHEPGADLDAWGPLPSYLAARLNVTVASFDLPGHGLSDDPWQPEQTAELLDALLAGSSRRRFVVAARSIAAAALARASELRLSGLVCLSPDAPEANPLNRSPRVPKLFFAGAYRGDDLILARRLAAASGGWAVVTALPLLDQGTGLLLGPWTERVSEEIAAFLWDCLRRDLTPVPPSPIGTGEGERLPPDPALLSLRKGRGAGGEGSVRGRGMRSPEFP